jgi:hypothetical protein
MAQTIRYSEYLRNVSLVEHQVSYNRLTPEISFDTHGKIIPYVAPPVALSTLDAFRLIKTHVQGRFMEQFRVVIPLAAYLVLFLVFILNQVVSAPWGMAFGLFGVGVTFAEPAIGALQTAGQLLSVETAPYLYTILSDWSGALVLVVGCGVGLAAVLGYPGHGIHVCHPAGKSGHLYP